MLEVGDKLRQLLVQVVRGLEPGRGRLQGLSVHPASGTARHHGEEVSHRHHHLVGELVDQLGRGLLRENPRDTG